MAPETRAPAAPATALEPAAPDVGRAVTTNGTPGMAVGGDTLPMSGTICPYLRMADGSHRTLGASRDHRCWAVEPPASVSAATQADLCLVASHAGCERYVAAQDRRAAGLASDHIPARLVSRPRFVIPVDPVPVVVDAKPSGREPGPKTPVTQAMMRRRVPLIAAGIGAAIVGVLGLAVLFGGSGSQPGPTAPLSAMAGSTPVATIAPAATPGPTTAATQPGTAPAASDAAVVPPTGPTPTDYPTEIARTYLVKEGDTYKQLAKRFGVKPRDLRALNGPLRVGERIVIPVGPWVTDAPA